MDESERAVAPRAIAGLAWRPHRIGVARANTCRIITPSPWKLPRMQESEERKEWPRPEILVELGWMLCYQWDPFELMKKEMHTRKRAEEQKRAKELERWLLRHLLCTFKEPMRLERCGTDLLLKPGMKSRGGFYAGYYATKSLELLSTPQMKIRAIGVQDFEVPAVLVSDVSKDWSRQTDTESFPGAASLHDKTGELQNGDPSLQGKATFSCEQQSGLAYTFPMRDTRVYCRGVLLQGKRSDDLELPQYSGVPLQGNGGASSLLRPRRGKEIYEHSGHPGVLGNVLGSCKPALTTCFFASTLGAVGAIAPETARDGYMQAGGSKSDTSNFWFGVVACVGVLFTIIGVVVAIMQLRRSRRNQTVTTPTRQTLTMQRRSRVQYIVEEETVHRIDEMA